LEAVKADRHTYEERRSGRNWGAAGLTTQDIEVAILIGYTAGTAAGLTVAGVVNGLRTWLRGAEAPTQPPQPLQAEDVWVRVEDFLSRGHLMTRTRALGPLRLGAGQNR
jgi:hypothetical protein